MYVKYLNGLDTPGSENAWIIYFYNQSLLHFSPLISWISEVKNVTGFDYRNKRHKMKKNV